MLAVARVVVMAVEVRVAVRVVEEEGRKEEVVVILEVSLVS
jgi:hypothetical protein